MFFIEIGLLYSKISGCHAIRKTHARPIWIILAQPVPDQTCSNLNHFNELPFSSLQLIVKWCRLIFLINTSNILYNIDIILHLHSDHNLVLYILITIWVLRTPNVGQNMLFQCFCSKSWKKKEAKKLMQN